MLLQIELLEKIEQFSKKGENRMKRIVLYILALLPLLSIVSLLLLAILLFPITLLPNNILPVAPIYIVELILGILLGLYGFRLRRLQIDNKLQIIYWILLGVSAGVLLLLKYRLIILLQPFSLILYSVLFEQRFQAIKNFFQKNLYTLAFSNFFDVIFISLLFWLIGNEELIKHVLNHFSDSLQVIHSSLKDLEIIFTILLCIIYIFIIPFIRGYLSVRMYKKQNNIILSAQRVLWNSYLKMSFFSFVFVSLYFVYTVSFYTTHTFLGVYIIVMALIMSLNVFPLSLTYVSIDEGGEKKDDVLAGWFTICLLSILLVLLDQIESDIIGILTWFLPVLLPVFIGEINLLFQSYRESETSSDEPPKPTIKMKRHLYWLQLMSFNTLLILNIFSSIFTNKDSGRNMAKEKIVEVLNSLNGSNVTSPFFPRIFSSFIIVLSSLVLAYGLSKIIIWFLKKIYLSPSKGYFQ